MPLAGLTGLHNSCNPVAVTVRPSKRMRFSPSMRALAPFATLVCALLAQEATRPPVGPAQPVPYSHKTHLLLGLNCKDCHPNPDPGNRMTFPAAKRCMACHDRIAKDRPAVKKLVEYARSGKPIPWVRVYAVPAEVYWNHRSHLAAGLECSTCHGEVPKMDAIAQVTNAASMEGCIECHMQRNVSTGCEFCHEDK
jgi:Cytochrome c7 and related cytochrome c